MSKTKNTSDKVTVCLTQAELNLLELITGTEAYTYVEALKFISFDSLVNNNTDLDQKNRIHYLRIEQLQEAITPLIEPENTLDYEN